MLLVGLLSIMSPFLHASVSLQQDDVTVILCFSGFVFMQLRVEDGSGHAFRRSADSDDPPEPIQRTSSGQ